MVEESNISFICLCRIYEQFMCINAASFLGIEQLPQFPHLQQLLGLRAAGAVELGHIVDPPIIRTATSILPLGWSGMPSNKNAEPLKVDIIGHGLHMCTLFQAQVNGKWYAIISFLTFILNLSFLNFSLVLCQIISRQAAK